jgi:hypothetical protein
VDTGQQSAWIALKIMATMGSSRGLTGWRKFETCPVWGAINMSAEFSAFWWTAERKRSARNGQNFAKSLFLNRPNSASWLAKIRARSGVAETFSVSPARRALSVNRNRVPGNRMRSLPRIHRK